MAAAVARFISLPLSLRPDKWGRPQADDDMGGQLEDDNAKWPLSVRGGAMSGRCKVDWSVVVGLLVASSVHLRPMHDVFGTEVAICIRIRIDRGPPSARPNECHSIGLR